MKKLFTIAAALILTSSIFAQAPEKMSYQSVIRNASDLLVTNQLIGMQISILQGSVSGTSVYTETQTPTSNINGLVTLEIGTGTVVSGVFGSINWGNGPYFIKTETDPTGGSSYTITGTNQLMSVPYALHAKKAEAADSLVGLSSANLTSLIELVTPPQIGDYRHGGVVFWIDPTDPWSGLVCAVDDQTGGTTVTWSNNNAVTGAFDTLIGSGQSNTPMITTTQGAGTYAAKMCEDLSLNGFNDWFLPSRDELNKMFVSKTIIANTSIANGGTGFGLHYWSSSEVNGNANLSYMQSFSFGAQYQAAKLNSANVRAVRAF
jgi:hypothetical protein